MDLGWAADGAGAAMAGTGLALARSFSMAPGRLEAGGWRDGLPAAVGPAGLIGCGGPVMAGGRSAAMMFGADAGAYDWGEWRNDSVQSQVFVLAG